MAEEVDTVAKDDVSLLGSRLNEAAGEAGIREQPAHEDRVAEKVGPRVPLDKLVNEKGEFVENWQTVLSDDLKEEKQLKNFKSIEGLARTVVSQSKMIGNKRGIVPPQENAPQEEWDKFYNELGRPEAPESYDLNDPEDLPEDFELDQEVVSGFKSLAHRLGLNQKQADELYKWGVSREAALHKELAIADEFSFENSEKKLKKVWGMAYDKKLMGANQVVGKYDPEGEIERSGLGNHPVLAKVFANIAEDMSEAKLLGRSSPAMTPEDADAKLQTIFNNPKHPYWNRTDPNHTSAIEQVQHLLSVKAG